MPDHEPQPKETRPRITLVCKGKTYLTDGRTGIVFLEVKEGGSPGDARLYDLKDLRHVRIGSVYDVEIDPAHPNSIYAATMRWLRIWENTEEAATWQIAADAFDTRELAIKHERKETSRRLPLELLHGIRKQYWSTNAAGRLAIEVRVLAYLRQDKLAADLRE
jgi:hypothetical protein